MSHKCPVCGSLANFLFTSKHKKDIFLCESDRCGHFYTPVTQSDQGVCVRDVDIESESNRSLVKFEKRNRRLIEFFRKQLSGFDGKKMLDFGAGDAHISRTFKNIIGDNAVIYCLEPNPLCKDFYGKYGLVQISDIDSLDVVVDFVYMIEVVEHLTDPIAVLRQLRKKMTGDGYLFISTPLATANEDETNAFDTESHLHFFTTKSLNLALIEAGFLSIESKLIPEMYPNIWDRGLVRGIAISFLRLLRKNEKYGHLVGFSKPI